MAELGAALELGPTNERRGAVDQAAEYLNALLDLRRVRPGERLPPAAALATEIGVSRPAVLQALKILASQGRVIVRPGRGGTWAAETEARTMDDRVARAWQSRDRIIQMAHLREMLEPGVARLVAERGLNATTLNQARRIVQRIRECDPADVDTYRALDTDFHLLIAKAARMPMILSYVTMCRSEVAAAFDILNAGANRKHSSDDEHDELLAALERRDQAEAARIAQGHAATTTVLLEAALKREGKRRGLRP